VSFVIYGVVMCQVSKNVQAQPHFDSVVSSMAANSIMMKCKYATSILIRGC
jgi:hypothetical protein